MKTPTVSELRQIAADCSGCSDLNRQQANEAGLSPEDRARKLQVARSLELCARALVRWADDIDAQHVMTS